MNWPAELNAVTATVTISAGWVSTRCQSAIDSTGGRTPLGMARQTQAAPTPEASAAIQNAERQPKCSASQADSGMPSTEAIDQPRKMKVMARPRCAAGVIAAIAAAAWGVNTAAPNTVTERTSSSVPKFGAIAASACPSANQASAAANSRRLSKLPKAAANSGAPKAINTAATVTSCPPTATLTARSRVRSLSVPVAAITPTPMAKLPNSSDQRRLAVFAAELASATLAGAGVMFSGSPSEPRD